MVTRMGSVTESASMSPLAWLLCFLGGCGRGRGKCPNCKCSETQNFECYRDHTGTAKCLAAEPDCTPVCTCFGIDGTSGPMSPDP